ncbi:ABC transporter substrate-binding protein [Haloferacaceae archaeon DSL9]
MSNGERPLNTSTRRQFLRLTGTTTAVAASGFAGCLGGSGGDLDELTVAYMPIYPDMQYFIMQEEGYFGEIDADVSGQEFTDGPSIVQAYGSGDLDVAMFGVVPSMIVIDRELPAKVTAANIREPMMIMARDSFTSMWDEQGADAFADWEAERGEPFRFGTFPQGSVPDMLLRYWLSEIGVDPESDVEITELGGANAVWQAMNADEIDGTSIMEPVPTRAEQEGSDIVPLVTASEIMPGQPAAVTLMSDEVRESDLASQFLEQHVRATEFIDERPDAAAEHASEVIGLPLEQTQAALESPLANFVTDPREIEEGTRIFAERAYASGRIDTELSTDDIFDYSVYDEL